MKPHVTEIFRPLHIPRRGHIEMIGVLKGKSNNIMLTGLNSSKKAMISDYTNCTRGENYRLRGRKKAVPEFYL